MKRKDLIFLSPVVVASVVLSWSMLTGQHVWGDDFSAYIMQAISILDGTTREFVQRNAFTIDNSTFLLGPHAYPWGFPFFLALAYGVCGLDLLCLKLPAVGFYALFLVVYFVMLQRRLSRWESLLLVALFAFNPMLLRFLDHVLSDLPFLFFSTLALLLVDYLIVAEIAGKSTILAQGSLGLGLFLAFFVRTNGFLLLPTLFLSQAIVFYRSRAREVDWRQFVLLAAVPYLVFAGLELFVLFVFPTGQESHLAELSGASLGRFMANAELYAFTLPAELFAGMPLHMFFYGVAFSFFVVGFVFSIKREFHFSIYYLFSVLLVSIWPNYQGTRFIFPILPLFVYFSFVGMKVIIGLLGGRDQRWASMPGYLFWGVALMTSSFVSVQNAAANLKNDRTTDGPFGSYSQQMFEFIRVETGPHDVIVFFKPRVMRMMTGRNAIAVHECSALGRGDYVVIHSKREPSAGQVDPELVTNCNPDIQLELVFKNNHFVVYEVGLVARQSQGY
jgi:hypothetical protein